MGSNPTATASRSRRRPRRSQTGGDVAVIDASSTRDQLNASSLLAHAALSRSHAEIEHQVGRFARLLDELDGQEADVEDVVELRGLLYGLYAILRLHDAQEEEGAFSLVHEPGTTPAIPG